METYANNRDCMKAKVLLKPEYNLPKTCANLCKISYALELIHCAGGTESSGHQPTFSTYYAKQLACAIVIGVQVKPINVLLYLTAVNIWSL